MKFKDRNDAALRLIPYLAKYRNDNGMVLAVPRGGVPIGYHLALHYHLPLELLMTKKIGHPLSEEFAIGAVSPEDHIVDEGHNIPEIYIEKKIREIRENLRIKYLQFMGDHRPADLENKTVIIADDGIATGNTVLASIRMIKKKKPRKIIVVTPVSSASAAMKIRGEVDDFICLYTPETFFGVGLYYEDFSEVSDDEVSRLLKEINRHDKAA